MGYIQLLASPFYQLAVFAFFLIATAVYCRFDSQLLITIQFYVFLLWMLASLVFGLFVDKPWTYFWQAGLSFVGFFALFIGIALLAEKISQKDGGDAWMGMLALASIFAVLMVVSAVLNGLISLGNMAQ